jgi:protein-L-isoaspartate(D-aspartate) O-methyltransferase
MFEADSYKHKGLRSALVQNLYEKGIRQKEVLWALESVPRHYFMDSAFLAHAYEDKPFPIGEGQTISQPYTVAFQSELLDIKPNMKVLEIGTGSGYQACVLAAMGAEVYTIEINKKLFQKTEKLLKIVSAKSIKTFLGDGTVGLPDFAPFDRILVTAGSPQIPEILAQQLVTGGKLVIPVGDSETQSMLLLRKENDGSLNVKAFGEFKFVPLIGKNGWQMP